jgi:hypothetical protein
MTIKLTIKYDATDEVWYAYNGEAQDDSRWVGQGTSPEDACADFWYQAHGDVAELGYDEDTEQWGLWQGSYRIAFPTKEEAVAYANAHEWQIEKHWRNTL